MTYSQDNQGNQNNSVQNTDFDGTRDTREGWTVDPSDGEKLYVTSRGRTKYSSNVGTYRDDSDNGGVNTLGDFLRQHPLSVQNDDPSELPPVQTNRDTARRTDRNLEGEQHDAAAIRAYEERMQAQDFVADMQAGRLSPQFIYSQLDAMKRDEDFQNYAKQYNSQAEPVNWTPELREQFERIAKMFGTRACLQTC